VARERFREVAGAEERRKLGSKELINFYKP